MIRTYLQALLEERFPDKPFTFHEAMTPFATLESQCAEIGRLELCDDGDELTVYLTELTHGHFGCFDEGATIEDKEKRIAHDVVEFLSALFADRVVAFRVFGGLAAGWTCLKLGDRLPGTAEFRRQYVWSGPVTNEKTG